MKIKNKLTAEILFECDKESVKETLICAVSENISLRDAFLRGANLRGADLRDADLRAADLRDADLRDADLRDADLGGADLRGADLRGADLRGADLYKLKITEKVKEDIIESFNWEIEK